jgi:hypothetical protein
MSVTAASAIPIPIPTPGVYFAKVFPRFDELGAAGQRLWMFLWEKTRYGTRPVRITDPEIATACGRSVRWVQKALAQLLNLMEDGVPTPVIDRFREYGPRHLAGRVIQIIVQFAAPAEPQPRAMAPTRAGAKAAAAAGTPAATRATPPPPPDDEPPPSPELAREAVATLRAEMARMIAETDSANAQEPAPGADSRRPEPRATAPALPAALDRSKKTPEQIRAEYEFAAARRKAQARAAGTPDGSPGSPSGP